MIAPIRLQVASGPRLGQIPESLTRPIASAIVEEAAPRLRTLVQEERARAAESLRDGLPWAGLSAAAFVASAHLVPERMGAAKALGYAASAALMAYGAWRILSRERAPEAPPTGAAGGVVRDVAVQVGRELARELEPRMAAILASERARAAEAGKAALPYVAASAVAFAGTLLLVPEENGVGKFAGYAASALSLVFGLWSAFDEESKP